ncbi:hypothetical protein [Bosea sp. 47.2.35]|uniref:hypothetical protein n=1 Tax=Bosea sp. 47.2.35 TaxID=2969304 RepID=UPI00214F9E2F|nr:hypothetical protein [Bosea sp. 47.2.35]MCR4520973.1 hypothetical protein [Bosea sp. 47.2.35]
MTTENNTPMAKPSSDRTCTRMSRRQFNSFLYDLYGCKGKNDVAADAVYEAEDFYVEVFTASPAGLMIAVHHGFRGFNYQIVDVMRPATDVAVEKVAA